MSSTRTGNSFAYPSTVRPTLSPTSSASTPARSASRANGASYAVTHTSGTPPLRARNSETVTDQTQQQRGAAG